MDLQTEIKATTAEPKFSVYMHIAPNGKRYVGITSKDPECRWQNGNGYRHNVYFSNSIKKHGWENIEHIVLFTELTEEEASDKEVELIALYKSNVSDFGYNLTSGGEKHKRVSEKSRQKMSENRKGLCCGENNHRYGKPVPQHQKNALSERQKGNKYSLGNTHSEEARRKMRENHADFRGEKHPRFGVKHTEEARLKISQNRTYTTGSEHPSSKRVAQYTTDGVLVKIWCSRTAAVDGFRDKPSSSIRSCCSGRSKTAYGYVWKYAI